MNEFRESAKDKVSHFVRQLRLSMQDKELQKKLEVLQTAKFAYESSLVDVHDQKDIIILVKKALGEE